MTGMGVEQQTDTGDLVPLAGAVYLFRPAGGDRGWGTTPCVRRTAAGQVVARRAVRRWVAWRVAQPAGRWVARRGVRRVAALQVARRVVQPVARRVAQPAAGVRWRPPR